MEIFCVFSSTTYFTCFFTERVTDIFVGGLFSPFIWYEETCFYVLTCVERYLAVVDPITYLSLRNKTGIRIRNVCFGCVWVLCISRLSCFVMRYIFLIMDFCLLVISLLIMSACCISVLYVLIHPGPGERWRERVDTLKKTAYHNIMTILGVLFMRFSGSLIWSAFFMAEKKSHCSIMACIVWCNIPSSLVLPLMFVHRSGKLLCYKNSFH